MVDLQSMRLVRRRANDAIEIEEIEDDFDVPDDAVVALDLLRDQFPPTAGPLPVAWVSQIYSLVKDRTAVDRQLDAAMRRQQLRLFRLVGHATDELAVHMEDYAAAAHRAIAAYSCKRKRDQGGWRGVKSARTASQPGRSTDGGAANDASRGTSSDALIRVAGLESAEIVDRFIHGVLPEFPHVSISGAALRDSLAAGRDALGGAGSPIDSIGGATVGNSAAEADGAKASSSAASAFARSPLRRLTASEAQQAVEVLDNAGLVLRKDANSYLFAVPGIGALQGQMLHGRQELLQVMSRKKFGEMLARDAEKISLKHSALGARFHLRDLVGRGNVELVDTTTGPLAKVISGTKSIAKW